MKTAILLFPLLALSPLALAKNFEQDRDIVQNWKEYYRGNPSFKWSQDPNLDVLEKSLNETKERKDEAQANLKPFKEIIKNENKAINDRIKENSQLDQESNEKLKLKFRIGTQIMSLRKQLELATNDIQKAEIQAKLTAVENQVNEIEARLTQIQAQKAANDQANITSAATIANVEKETKKIEEIYSKLEESYVRSLKRHDEYKKTLVLQILRTNHKGSDLGRDHSLEDATDLANELGSLYGTRDGSIDGEEDGKEEGRNKARNIGQQEGRRIGLEEARSQGQRDGEVVGSRAGNSKVGLNEGQTTGLSEARNSDAADKGLATGSAEGMKQAQVDGQRDGENLGKTQVISKYEDVKLKEVSLDGTFSGSFKKDTPTYPDSRGRGGRYNDRGSYKEAILKEAYKDGYEFTYNRNHRVHFNSVIDEVYSRYYSRQFQITFGNFANRDYPQVRENALENERRDTYRSQYPIERNNAADAAQRRTLQNPDRSSEDYKVSFQSAKSSAFSSEYINIFEAEKLKASTNTYNQNYPGFKEVTRAQTATSTESIYINSSVIKVESISVREVGIRGVGSEDGVFQPGENKVIDITISNFGKASKEDVKVFVKGKEFKVGSIPGETKVKITAVAKGEVSNRIGDIDSDQIIVTASSKNAIESRHFVKASEGIVKSEMITNGRVKYPISVDQFGLSEEVLVGSESSLRLMISNASKKVYDNVTVTLRSDTSDIIKKDFAPIRNLTDSKSVTDAIVAVTKNDQAYTPINMSLVLEKDGVVVGELDKSLTFIAKQKLDTSKNVIIVGDASTSLRDIQDLISENGGLSKVGILDTTVRSANNEALEKGLKSKVLLVNTQGRVTEKLEDMLRNSENIAIVTTDSEGQERFKRHGALFSNSISETFSLAGGNEKTKILFANPRMNDKIKTSLPVIQADARSYRGELELAKSLAMSNSDLISNINTTVNAQNYFSDEVTKKKMEAAVIRVFDEAMQINTMYDESNSFFGDKDIAEIVVDDKTLFHNMLNESLEKSADNANIGSYLTAHNVTYSLEDSKSFEDGMKNAVHKRLFTYKRFFKKIVGPLSEMKDKMGRVSKFNKELFKKLDSKRGHHNPINK